MSPDHEVLFEVVKESLRQSWLWAQDAALDEWDLDHLERCAYNVASDLITGPLVRVKRTEAANLARYSPDFARMYRIVPKGWREKGAS